MPFVRDTNFTDQLLGYLEQQSSLTEEDQEAQAKYMAAADALYAKMDKLVLPETEDTESLDRFFTPEKMGRVLFCPKINRDMLDDWGIYGTEPGFFFLESMAYSGTRSLNDQTWLQGRSIRMLPGLSMPIIDSWDSFPRRKFDFDWCTSHRHPHLYEYLIRKFEAQLITADRSLPDGNQPALAGPVRNDPPSTADILKIPRIQPPK